MFSKSRGVAGEIAEVRRSGGELCLHWRIPRFLDLHCGFLPDYYRSPPFGFHDARWHLRVYPDWTSSGKVSLFLRRDDDDAGPSARTVILSAGLRGSGGGVEWRTEEEEREFVKGGGCWLGENCKRSELMEQKERLVPGGVLTVVCQMRVSPDTDATGELTSGVLVTYTYKELQTATQNFRDLPVRAGGCKIGEGAFGTVYRAVVRGNILAVKILKDPVDKQFMTELMTLTNYRHENLLPLIGISLCPTGGHQCCLLYEYMPNGSLEDRLACAEGSEPLSWQTRLSISYGTALGIHHLHTFGEEPMVHRDIKSANILLDQNFVPKVGDFGLVRTGSRGMRSSTQVFTEIRSGTLVYMPWEAIKGLQVSVKWDTFSFGVVLLELLTGLPPFDPKREDKDLVTHMELCEDIVQRLDPRADWNREAATELYGIARRRCLVQSWRSRSTISEKSVQKVPSGVVVRVPTCLRPNRPFKTTPRTERERMASNNRGMAGEIVEVRRSGGELQLDWRIPRFLDLPCGNFDYYESPRFGFHDARWFLRVYPDWGSSEEVPLFLHRDDDDAGPSTRTVAFSWGVRGSGGGVEKRTKELEREFEKGDGWWLFDDCKRSELLEQKERLVPGGVLTVVCQMRVSGTAATGSSSSPDVPIRTDAQTREPNARACKCQSLDKQEASTQTDTEFKEARVDGKLSSEKQDALDDGAKEKLNGNTDLENDDESRKKKNLYQLSRVKKTKKISLPARHGDVIRSLKAMLAGGRRADFSLKSGGGEWRVHRAILEGRSGHFGALFRGEWAERDEGRLDDVPGGALDGVLHFAYAGEVGDVSPESLCGTCAAARRFDMRDLESLCVECMGERMGPGMVCGALAVDGGGDLKERAMECFFRESGTICETEGWRELKANYPAIIAELFREFIKRERTKRKKERD